MSTVKKIAAFLILTLVALSFTACSGTKYKDGVYYSELPEFAASGWKETVEITIENGELTRINWDAIYKDDSIPIRKKQYSKSGLYGMLAAGAAGEWYDQAIAAEKYVLENGIESLDLDDGGYTDAISGCTIHVNALESLLQECLAQAQK